mmetsp:Transcript_58853/g.80337  ORF Transcript_58853/g.80337 Transcript_58853/m.80337 type:complete len:222 (-) Transcript_58853:194-859(-)
MRAPMAPAPSSSMILGRTAQIMATPTNSQTTRRVASVGTSFCSLDNSADVLFFTSTSGVLQDSAGAGAADDNDDVPLVLSPPSFLSWLPCLLLCFALQANNASHRTRVSSNLNSRRKRSRSHRIPYSWGESWREVSILLMGLSTFSSSTSWMRSHEATTGDTNSAGGPLLSSACLEKKTDPSVLCGGLSAEEPPPPLSLVWYQGSISSISASKSMNVSCST